MIRTVIRCPNNMVMVFDKEGEQLPEYQGWYEDVKGSLLTDAPPNAVFGCWPDFEPEPHKMPREEW